MQSPDRWGDTSGDIRDSGTPALVRFLISLVFAALLAAGPASGQTDQTAHPKSAAAHKKKSAAAAAKTAPATQPQKPPAPAAAAPPSDKPAQPPAAEARPDGKVPHHFASLRYDKVYLRSGPSTDYPIQWVYQRKGLPVEILADFDVWRKVRDIDGTEGWVNQLQLVGPRSVLVTGAIRKLRRDPKDGSALVAELEPGVVAAISKCDAVWCEVKAGGYRGWLKRSEVWGLEPDEIIQ